MEYPSSGIRDVVEALSRLPSIGRKTALRMTLHLLRTPAEEVEHLGQVILNLRRNTHNCVVCHNLSDSTCCNICTNPQRQQRSICVVSDVRDLLAIEKTSQYMGLYHVLGGLINPLAGIGPADLTIADLVDRIRQQLANGQAVDEVILALNGSPEGETTAFYIAKVLGPFQITVTSLARGIPVGVDLEFSDDLTIGRSLQQRVIYANPLSNPN